MYLADPPVGGMFCPTTAPLDIGAPVVIELNGKWLPNKVMIRGSVINWRPALPRRRVRAGAFVQFDQEEAHKRDFLLELAEGTRPPAPKRRHARLPVAMPVRVRLEASASPMDAELREVSVSGALVAGMPQAPLGTAVVLELVPPGGATPMDISGRVLYHAGTDQTGIKFVFREGGGSRRLRELVRRFRAA